MPSTRRVTPSGGISPRTSTPPWCTMPPPMVSASSSAAATSGMPTTPGNGSAYGGGHSARAGAAIEDVERVVAQLHQLGVDLVAPGRVERAGGLERVDGREQIRVRGRAGGGGHGGQVSAVPIAGSSPSPATGCGGGLVVGVLAPVVDDERDGDDQPHVPVVERLAEHALHERAHDEHPGQAALAAARQITTQKPMNPMNPSTPRSTR